MCYAARMRTSILRALLVKEARRHVANRGGIALCLLLVVAALLLSVFNPGAGAGGTGGGALVDGVHRCLVQYDRETPFVGYLRSHVPADLRPHVAFELVNGDTVEGLVNFPPGTGAVRLRDRGGDEGRRLAPAGAPRGDGPLRGLALAPPTTPASPRPSAGWRPRASGRGG